MNNKKILVVVIALVVLLCCCLATGAAVAGGLLFINYADEQTSTIHNDPVMEGYSEENPEQPGANDETPIPLPLTDEIVSDETLNTLKNAQVPVNDPVELARRLDGKTNIPAKLIDPQGEPQLNDTRKFWVVNDNTNENFQVTAALAYKGQNTYFFIQQGVDYDKQDLEALGDAFDQEMYPTNREFFGSEYTPGIDDDPRLYILYTSGLGDRIAGYFSSMDSYPSEVHQYSNGHEMFILNADAISLEEPFTYGVLAHEFQHMIHWYKDRNEESWLNEGFSELAAFLNGYYVDQKDYLYTIDPDLQLTDWPNDKNATLPHYGSSFLFVTYFLDRFGEEATQALVKDPGNGMDSVDTVLSELNVVDPVSGQSVTADDVFVDWTVANYLQDNSVADGRFGYKNYKEAPQTTDTQVIRSCPSQWENASVKQYGVDYIRLDCGTGTYQFDLETSSSVGVLPESANSGEYAFWSNKGDESNMRLTREFDFTGISAPLEMNFSMWYDLEEDYDYVYVTTSEDNGQTWQILDTPSGTDADPSGNNYGWGYNGVTEQWIDETLDLSAFAGKRVLIRFEYITDAAVNGEGFLLDDISVPAVNYSTDFETDQGGWQAEGFVRIENVLPQTYRLSIVTTTEIGDTSVQTYAMQPGENKSLALDFDENQNYIIVISGTTRFTRQEASYRFRVE